MKKLLITIPINPISVQHGARVGRGRFYSDPAKKKYFDRIASETSHLRPAHPLRGPLEATYHFYLESASRSGPAWAYGGSSPDLTNLIKGTEDALTRAGFWRNDKQIHRSVASMIHSDIGRIEIEVSYDESQQDSCATGNSTGHKQQPTIQNVRGTKNLHTATIGSDSESLAANGGGQKTDCAAMRGGA